MGGKPRERSRKNAMKQQHSKKTQKKNLAPQYEGIYAHIIWRTQLIWLVINLSARHPLRARKRRRSTNSAFFSHSIFSPFCGNTFLRPKLKVALEFEILCRRPLLFLVLIFYIYTLICIFVMVRGLKVDKHGGRMRKQSARTRKTNLARHHH